MSIIRKLNEGLENKYFLAEAKENQRMFLEFAGSQELVDKFNKLKRDGKITGNERDITWWVKNKTRKDLGAFVAEKEGEKSKTQVKKDKYADVKEGKDYEIIYKGQGWTIYRILTYLAAQKYGWGTKWCIAGNYKGHEKEGQMYFNSYKGLPDDPDTDDEDDVPYMEDTVEDYYFLISDAGDKWCYLDYVINHYSFGGEDEETYQDFWNDNDHSVFWSAENNGRTAFAVNDDVLKAIPREVLEHLPYIDDFLLSEGESEEYNTANEKQQDPKTYRYDQNQSPKVIRTLFSTHKELSKVVVPKEITKIQDAAFRYVTDIVEVLFEDPYESQLTEIGAESFSHMDIGSIVTPANLKRIGDLAFDECDSLSDVYFMGNSLRVIGEGAFASCGALTSITLPASVTHLGEGAFRDCSSLRSVGFMEDSRLKEIPNAAFLMCFNLENVELPQGLQSMGELAFAHCGMMGIILPASLKTIGERAFEETPLQTVIVRGEYRPELFMGGTGLADGAKVIWEDGGTSETIGQIHAAGGAAGRNV